MSNIYLSLLLSLICCSPALGFGEDSTIIASDIFQQQAVDQIVIESPDSNLEISIFTLSGEKVPYTLWRSRHENRIRYEAGYDLDKGIYLVQIKSENRVSYMKLLRKST